MTLRPNRRIVLTGLAATAGAWFLGVRAGGANSSPSTVHYEVTMSEQEWKKKLSPEQYAVLREAATERAFTSPLLEEHAKGTFVCAGCANKLFSSTTKFDSGTGWPSFWAPIDKTAVETAEDDTLGMDRTEVRCHRCGGHLGHVFDDGPAPTHLRYCMNGVALKFEPEKAS